MSNTKNEIKEGQLIFSLNEEDKTASIVGNDISNDTVFIPRSIKHQNQEFIITSIEDGSFKGKMKIKTIQFPPDSVLQIIERHSFSFNSIESISIPSNVKKIGEAAFILCFKLKHVLIPPDSQLQTIEKCAFSSTIIESLTIPPTFCEFGKKWCSGASKLTNLYIMEGNKNFKNYNDQMVIGKSNTKSDIFDVLIFANRDIKTITIPPFIKYIATDAFTGSIIENVLNIPSNVVEISEFAFSNCKNLKSIEFQSDSKLKKICIDAFYSSSIERISIPSCVTNLEKGWCDGTLKLNDVKIMENNPYFKNFEDKFVIGKSDINSDTFDVLLFSNRNIKEVLIPSFIKYIDSFAFSCSIIEKVIISSNVRRISESAFYKCKMLKNVEIDTDSELRLIESNAFFQCGIERITIPNKVTLIDEYSFSSCSNLCYIDIHQNSELKKIGKYAFDHSKINSIFIPSHVSEIGNMALNSLSFGIIELGENFELKSIGKKQFYFKTDLIIMKPNGSKCDHSNFNDLNWK